MTTTREHIPTLKEPTLDVDFAVDIKDKSEPCYYQLNPQGPCVWTLNTPRGVVSGKGILNDVLPRPRVPHPSVDTFDQVLSLSELTQCKYRGYSTDEGLETFSVNDIVLEECINNDHLCACGSCRSCPPTRITDNDAIVIDDIEEFDENDSKDDDHDGIKEFDYNDAMEDYSSSPPSVRQQKLPISCKNNVTMHPKKRYCDIVI
jgi:hypothetical protein